MAQESTRLKGFPISFHIYAENEQEVEMARKAIVEFIQLHASQCRAVTASKVAQALSNWNRNPFVKQQIINYFK